MGNSRNILETMVNNMNAVLRDSSIKYDLYRINPNQLDVQKIGKRCRMALYQDGELTEIRVGAYKPDGVDVRYAIDITVFRGYQNDDASKAELLLADYKDAVIDWAENVQPSIVTNQNLMYFGFDGATGITRLKNSVTQTIRFIGQRFYSTNQG